LAGVQRQHQQARQKWKIRSGYEEAAGSFFSALRCFTLPRVIYDGEFVSQVVLKSIMLRRRKDHIINGKPILDLPARNVEIVHCPFSASERAFYDAIQAKVEDSLEKIMGSEKKNYTSILLLLLRLRQGE
jgi:SNF2 family DNA or RNA helicase